MPENSVIIGFEFWTSLSSGVLGIVSFVVTLIINNRVGKIRNSYLFKIRCPEIVSDIKDLNKEIFQSLSFTDISHDTTELIRRLLPKVNKLQNMIKKYNRSFYRQSTKDLFNQIESHRSNYLTDGDREDARIIYYDLVELTEIIEMFLRDVKWS